jgi:hypothetical protein
MRLKVCCHYTKDALYYVAGFGFIAGVVCTLGAIIGLWLATL